MRMAAARGGAVLAVLQKAGLRAVVADADRQQQIGQRESGQLSMRRVPSQLQLQPLQPVALSARGSRRHGSAQMGSCGTGDCPRM